MVITNDGCSYTKSLYNLKKKKPQLKTCKITISFKMKKCRSRELCIKLATLVRTSGLGLLPGEQMAPERGHGSQALDSNSLLEHSQQDRIPDIQKERCLQRVGHRPCAGHAPSGGKGATQTGRHQEALQGPLAAVAVSRQSLPQAPPPAPAHRPGGVGSQSHLVPDTQRHQSLAGARLRTGLHRAGLVPSLAGAGAGASAQASHPPSRSGWLAEAVILLGSAGISPGKIATLSGASPGRGRQSQAPSLGGWEGTLCPPSRVSSRLGTEQPPRHS